MLEFVFGIGKEKSPRRLVTGGDNSFGQARRFRVALAFELRIAAYVRSRMYGSTFMRGRMIAPGAKIKRRKQ